MAEGDGDTGEGLAGPGWLSPLDCGELDGADDGSTRAGDSGDPEAGSADAAGPNVHLA